MNYSIDSVQGTIHQGLETFSKPSRGRQCAFMALSTLCHNESVRVHSWTNQSLIKYSSTKTVCIQMHFQTIKYPMPILYILCICRWWQICFMMTNLWQDMAIAALHLSLRMTSLRDNKNYLLVIP